jgi:hypothetical protein
VRTRLRRDLPAAIKVSDAVVVAVLLSTLAAIDTVEAVDLIVGRRATGSQHFAGATSGRGPRVAPRPEPE